MLAADKNVLLTNMHLQFQFQKMFYWKPKNHIDFLFHNWEQDNIYKFLINGRSKYFNT